MYSKSIRLKVEKLFDDLRREVSAIVRGSLTADKAASDVTRLINSELTARSKSILSDMLFDLSDDLMKTEFFADIERQNKFYEINLRREILSKYQFVPNTKVDYKETSRVVQALKVGGGVLAVGGVAEIGVVLIASLSFSSLVPIPVSILVAASIGAALVDYYAIEPKKNRATLKKALDQCLIEAEQQFLNFFDAVEKYFNMRAEEIKQTM